VELHHFRGLWIEIGEGIGNGSDHSNYDEMTKMTLVTNTQDATRKNVGKPLTLYSLFRDFLLILRLFRDAHFNYGLAITN
jgi:hypothetical protein